MTLSLEWNDEQDALEIGEPLIAMLDTLLKLAAEAEGIESGDVVISFVGDEAIRVLNRDYRNIDKATDVLSFSMLESVEGEPEILYEDDEELDEDLDDDGQDAGDTDEEYGEEYPEPLGDIVISVERAIEQAQEYGHSVEREIGFLFVHGFLHLIGYDHGDEESERIMFEKQEAVLQKAGLRR
ncbi:rRNA maturation RNase YbeY [Paenibacillus mesophilus]|uniref:rRNA maturation RNase YbeY n=1 Tax=Paenibacillus mesophilus TaxID=2582849 RepID=UPI00110DA70D|nr:rRNA maturation RNase YbeY [Paenibacillus mesophilus]TMV44606.1 rRNA maturation RNase YbeY [Paenibacillus mesophilus]